MARLRARVAEPARRKQRVAEATDPRYAAIVRQSLERDEEHLRALWAQLHAAAKSDG